MAIGQRIVELDILKCIGIVMVVIGHTECPSLLDSMIYFIHMPLFFYLSGVTNRDDCYYNNWTNIKEFFAKRVKTLYIPFLKFAIPICILHNLFFAIGLYNIHYNTTQYIQQILRTIFFSVGETEPFLPQLWFIKVLFLAEMFYAVIVYLCKKMCIDKWCAIVPLCTIFFLMPTEWFPHVMRTNFIWPIRALLFYALGSIHSKIIGCRLSSWYIMLVGLVVWIFASIWYGHISINGVYGLSALILIYLIFFTVPVFYSLASWIKEFKVGTMLAGGGRMCMHVYFWHYVVFKVTSAIYVWMICPTVDNLQALSCSCFVEGIVWWQYSIIVFFVFWVIGTFKSVRVGFIRY